MKRRYFISSIAASGVFPLSFKSVVDEEQSKEMKRGKEICDFIEKECTVENFKRWRDGVYSASLIPAYEVQCVFAFAEKNNPEISRLMSTAIMARPLSERADHIWRTLHMMGQPRWMILDSSESNAWSNYCALAKVYYVGDYHAFSKLLGEYPDMTGFNGGYDGDPHIGFTGPDAAQHRRNFHEVERRRQFFVKNPPTSFQS